MNRITKGFAAVGLTAFLALGLAACDDELRDELDITEEALTPEMEFANDAFGKLAVVEANHEILFEGMIEAVQNPNLFDDPEEVAQLNEKLDAVEAAQEVELLPAVESVTTTSSAVTYYDEYKRLNAEYVKLMREGINGNDQAKILQAVEVQDEMLNAFGIAIKSVIIVMDGKGVGQQQ